MSKSSKINLKTFSGKLFLSELSGTNKIILFLPISDSVESALFVFDRIRKWWRPVMLANRSDCQFVPSKNF
jgi:hypothetical protein